MFARSLRGVGLALMASGFLLQTATGATRDVVFRGKVVIDDGSPLPKSATVERGCSNTKNPKRGPLTRKDGTFTWHLQVDSMQKWVCYVYARLEGYTSNNIDISAFTGYGSPVYVLPDLVLHKNPDSNDPRVMNLSEDNVPRPARDAWKEAIKAIKARDPEQVLPRLNDVVEAAPEFARGWQTLGVIQELLGKPAEAYESFRKAAEYDEDYAEPRVILSEYYAEMGDWEKTKMYAERLTKIDKKRNYPNGYLYLAAADYHLGDLKEAKKAAEKAMDKGETRRIVRGQYVLGRVLVAEGDLEKGRKEIEEYLEAEPDAADAEEIRASLETLGDDGKQPPLIIF